MRGAIGAGHRLTAEAGAAVLGEGGNAVDACIAAAFASWVAEGPLTGPGAGGFMLVHRAQDASSRVLDFFVAVPGVGRGRRDGARMEHVEVDFTPESSQAFRIGAASCAVPGALAGLAQAHRSYGSLPWAQLVEPAIALARDGIELTPPQAYLHAILDLILRHTDEGRRVYGRNGERLVAGDTLRQPDLAATLERIAGEGASALYGGELAQALVEHVRANGGEITAADLAGYRVIRRRPVRAAYRGHEVESNPPPSSGGILIAYGLRLLDALGEGGSAGSADAIARLAEVMREQSRARTDGFGSALFRGGLAGRLLSDEAIAAAAGRIRASEAGRPETAARGTTHISVVDAAGNAASLTASLGSGSGVVVPGTGIHLNNMLGEYDLALGNERPGARLTSMMAPSLVLDAGRPRLVVGSAGSIRLRGAIMQLIVNVVGHGMGVEEAVAAPRVHVDEPALHCEGGAGVDADALTELEERGYAVTRWRKRNLFFGGVSAVEVLSDGSLAAAGDPRRGGAGIVVE
jgi:gamma-glutamyltranspeptidase/glutathione hydrolase